MFEHGVATLTEILRRRAREQADRTAFTFLADGEVETRRKQGKLAVRPCRTVERLDRAIGHPSSRLGRAEESWRLTIQFFLIDHY